jgi:hypothetical protein
MASEAKDRVKALTIPAKCSGQDGTKATVIRGSMQP